MAKKSKKRARQAARRAERREEKRVTPAENLGPELLNRIFREAHDRRENAAYQRERLRVAELRREERARARGERPNEVDELFDEPEDDWFDDWLEER